MVDRLIDKKKKVVRYSPTGFLMCVFMYHENLTLEGLWSSGHCNECLNEKFRYTNQDCHGPKRECGCLSHSFSLSFKTVAPVSTNIKWRTLCTVTFRESNIVCKLSTRIQSLQLSKIWTAIFFTKNWDHSFSQFLSNILFYHSGFLLWL